MITFKEWLEVARKRPEGVVPGTVLLLSDSRFHGRGLEVHISCYVVGEDSVSLEWEDFSILEGCYFSACDTDIVLDELIPSSEGPVSATDVLKKSLELIPWFANEKCAIPSTEVCSAELFYHEVDRDGMSVGGTLSCSEEARYVLTQTTTGNSVVLNPAWSEATPTESVSEPACTCPTHSLGGEHVSSCLWGVWRRNSTT